VREQFESKILKSFETVTQKLYRYLKRQHVKISHQNERSQKTSHNRDAALGRQLSHRAGLPVRAGSQTKSDRSAGPRQCRRQSKSGTERAVGALPPLRIECEQERIRSQRTGACAHLRRNKERKKNLTRKKMDRGTRSSSTHVK
jgi:hypothetical protein